MKSKRKARIFQVVLMMIGLGLLSSFAISRAVNGPPPSASGTGQNDDQGVLLTFSASDHTQPGDTTPDISGIAKERDLFAGTTVVLDINCIQVAGNLAIMSGPVISAPEGIPLDVDMVFAVIDNGEGKKAPPDVFSRFQTMGKGTCAQQKLTNPDIQSQRGNIQVRGDGGGSSGGGGCPVGTHLCCADQCVPEGVACPGCPPDPGK